MQASETFRLRLREAMAAARLTQRELAERVGTGYPGINRILQGKQNPSIDLADRIADAVGVALADLLAGKKSRKVG